MKPVPPFPQKHNYAFPYFKRKHRTERIEEKIEVVYVQRFRNFAGGEKDRMPLSQGLFDAIPRKIQTA
ncbi:MAG TPA: hypothetical protein VMG09_04765 [Bacteroidota bacterium]|nr:hypothetical protein [Bacteroidota bacterium]